MLIRLDRLPCVARQACLARLARVATSSKRIGGARFLLFAMVGGLGVVTHLAILRLAIGVFGMAFPAGQALAACVAMAGNFLLNNISTYRDRRLRGAALARGLFIFCGISAIGLAANVAVAAHLFRGSLPWWAAGLGGAAAGSLWNDAMSAALVWRARATLPPPRRRAVPADRSRAAIRSAGATGGIGRQRRLIPWWSADPWARNDNPKSLSLRAA